MAREPAWLDLDQILPAVPVMAAWDVSAVARSPRGFLTAYARAGGDPSRWVISTLLTDPEGTRILVAQARRKERAAPGERVP